MKSLPERESRIRGAVIQGQNSENDPEAPVLPCGTCENSAEGFDKFRGAGLDTVGKGCGEVQSEKSA
jgi:hypothetical protein